MSQFGVQLRNMLYINPYPFYLQPTNMSVANTFIELNAKRSGERQAAISHNTFLRGDRMAGGLVTSRRLGDQFCGAMEVILQIRRFGGHFCGDHGASAPPPSSHIIFFLSSGSRDPKSDGLQCHSI